MVISVKATLSNGLPHPGEPDLHLQAPEIRVAIPADISAVMARSMELALAWRQATREALTHYMGQGYEVQELLRGADTSDYLLVRTEDG